MATPRKSTIPQSISVDDALLGEEQKPQSYYDPGEIGEEDISADLALRSALATIGESESDAKVIVYQIDEKTKKDVYLYDCGVVEFATSGLNEIQARYGAGEYRIRVYAPGRGVLTHRRISIGAPKTPTAPPVPPQAASMDLAALMAQQQAAFLAGMREIVGAIAHRPEPAGMGVHETIQLIGALQGMGGGRREVDPIDMIGKIVALQRDILPPTNANGEIDSGAVIMRAIDAFGKPLMEMAAKSQAAGSAPVAQIPMAVNPAPQLPAPAPQPSEDEMRFIAMKTMLMHAAKNNGDHYVYASNLLDFMGDETASLFLNAPNWREQLETMIPEAAQYRDWIAAVRDVALDLLKGDEEPVTVPGTTSPPPTAST